MHRSTINPRRSLVALVAAVLVVAAACVPQYPGPTPPTPDGDGFKRMSTSREILNSSGYSFAIEYAPESDLRMTLLRQKLDPLLNNAATQLNVHTGLPFPGVTSLWHGTFGDAAPTGKITVTIVTGAEMAAIGCPGANVVGCGGVSTASGKRVLSGHIAILDQHIIDASDLALSTTVLHELGHALNLAHYNGRYDNRNGGTEYQTMCCDAGTGHYHAATGDYRAGDKNGLKYMAAGSLEAKAGARSSASTEGEIEIVDDVMP
ncbi:MAG: hypothetical protein R3A49_05065 [Acidimicrobiia bacterium]